MQSQENEENERQKSKFNKQKQPLNKLAEMLLNGKLVRAQLVFIYIFEHKKMKVCVCTQTQMHTNAHRHKICEIGTSTHSGKHSLTLSHIR